MDNNKLWYMISATRGPGALHFQIQWLRKYNETRLVTFGRANDSNTEQSAVIAAPFYFTFFTFAPTLYFIFGEWAQHSSPGMQEKIPERCEARKKAER